MTIMQCLGIEGVQHSVYIKKSHVKQGNWLKILKKTEEWASTVCLLWYMEVKNLHCLHPMGVKGTLYLIHRIDPEGIQVLHLVSVNQPHVKCAWNS